MNEIDRCLPSSTAETAAPLLMEERSIGGRNSRKGLPLTIGGEEEAHIRQVVTEIGDSVTRLKEHYPLTDRQDLLAMAALEVATRA